VAAAVVGELAAAPWKPVCHAFVAFGEGAVQISKARPVEVFCAGQVVVAAIEVGATIPAPARTAAPATPHVAYPRFFD
jgi:hypothetical protein